MVSTWRSKSNALALETLNEKLEDLKNVSYNFSEIVNQRGDSFGVKGKGSPTGAFGATSGNQIFNPTVQVISEFDEVGTATGVFDRLNISSRFMIVKSDDPTDVNIKWIQLATANGQPALIQVEKGKTGHLQVGGNVDIGSQVDFADNEIVEVMFSEESDITTEGGFVIVGPVGSGGGGGVDFPIDFPITFLGTIGGITQPIDFSLSTRHGWKAEFTGDITLTFDNPPTGTVAYSVFRFKQDGTGGHSLTLPVGTVNKDIVEAGFLTGIDEETGIVIEFFNDTFYAFLETGNVVSGGFAFSGNLSDLVIDVPKNWLAQGVTNFGSLSGVTDITMTGATATLSAVNILDFDGSDASIDGLQLLQFFQASQQIESLSTGIEYSIGDLQSHLFKSLTDDIAQFEEAASGVFRLDMLDHAVKDALNITFSNTEGAVVFAGSSPAIGFDSDDDSLVMNVPAGAKITISENTVVGSTQIFNDGIISDTLTADSDLFIGILGTSPPTVTGQFTNDATDVFVFSGGAARNMSNISVGVSATTELDNLTITSINAALLPESADTLDLGDAPLPWRILHIKDVEFDTDSSVPTALTATQISKNASGNLAFNNAATGGGFLYYFEGVNKWSMTSTQLSGDFILLQNSLTFNDSITNPAGDGELTRNGDSVLLQSPTFQLQRATTGTFSGDFNLTKVDAAPSGGEPIYDINFNLFDSPSSITYAQISGEIIDVTDAGSLLFNVRADGSSNVNAITIEGAETTSNRTFVSLNAESRIGSDLKFQSPTGSTDLKIFPVLNQLGIVVQDNISFTVGTLGTLAIPVVITIGSTIAEIDALFGDHVGAMGMFDSGSSDPVLFIKMLSGSWATVNLAVTIVS